MKYGKNKIIHFIFFYMVYLNVELHDRAYHAALIGFNGISKWSLAGWTSLWMGLIGGSLITAVELLLGIFFNLYLHLNLWDYSYDRFNFLGQICLKNCIYWYLLSIIIIWLDDALSYYYYGDEKPGSLFSYLKKLVKLQ